MRLAVCSAAAKFRVGDSGVQDGGYLGVCKATEGSAAVGPV